MKSLVTSPLFDFFQSLAVLPHLVCRKVFSSFSFSTSLESAISLHHGFIIHIMNVSAELLICYYLIYLIVCLC